MKLEIISLKVVLSLRVYQSLEPRQYKTFILLTLLMMTEVSMLPKRVVMRFTASLFSSFSYFCPIFIVFRFNMVILQALQGVSGNNIYSVPCATPSPKRIHRRRRVNHSQTLPNLHGTNRNSDDFGDEEEHSGTGTC